ncbi:MAG: hypothetical protein QF595_08090 [Dehalococcoidia bacterium]|nr:hypothetical protein [Dehalococcoidia bacterium]
MSKESVVPGGHSGTLTNALMADGTRPLALAQGPWTVRQSVAPGFGLLIGPTD